MAMVKGNFGSFISNDSLVKNTEPESAGKSLYFQLNLIARENGLTRFAPEQRTLLLLLVKSDVSFTINLLRVRRPELKLSKHRRVPYEVVQPKSTPRHLRQDAATKALVERLW